jgi:diguanylate cyclase (GGDEF)-like protein
MRAAELTPFSRLLHKTLLTFLIVGMLALCTYGVYSWKREEQDARENFQILSSFLASFSQIYFDDLGNGLAPLGDLLDQLDLRKNPESARLHLNNFIKRYPSTRAVAVFAPDGVMLINTAVQPGDVTPDFRLDPPYIKQLLSDMASTEPYTIGPPEFGKAIKLWRFTVRYVVRDQAGRSKFLVQAAIPLEKEGTFLHQLPVPPNSYIGLLRADGYQQARFPISDASLIYGKLSPGPVAKIIKEQPDKKEGYFSGSSSWIDGESSRVGAFTRLPKREMYAYVSVPASYLLMRWWQHNAPVLFTSILFFGVFVFITYRMTKRERYFSSELFNQAMRDPLTGLPNRACLNSILDANIISASSGQRKFSVLLLDLDRFKGINDTFGHVIGDKLLIRVAQTIQTMLRGGDVLGRFGGDDFLLILPGSDESGVMLVTQRILDSFKAAFDIDGHALRITPSIGIAIYPEHGDDIETLLKHADTAMYESKRLGRNAYTIYVEQLGRRVRDRLEMEHQLREALQNEEFRLFYQPVVDMQTGGVVAVEALVRWEMPNGKLLMPEEFIHVAEDSGMIIPLGEWVLRTACRQLKLWLSSGLKLRMAVNLSTRQFQDALLMEKIMAILKETGIETSRLELEITETAAMLHPEETVALISAFANVGVRIAIDDFGTGYSSLSYLKRIPANTIKIDKMFVEGLGSELQDATIVRTVIALAHALGKETVAEGIETAQQYEQIAAMGCDFAQGYLLSLPLDAEALTSLMVSSTDKNIILLKPEMFKPAKQV